LYYLIAIEIARKYTRSLIIGFFVGILLTYGALRSFPAIITSLTHATVRIGIVGHFTPSNIPSSILADVSSSLTSITANGSPEPELASQWEATNSGKTFIFTIRDDFLWHSGKTVTAHDINYNIKGVTLIPSGNNTLTAYLQYPYSPFPTLVSKPILLPGLTGFGEYKVSGIRIQGDTVQELKLTPKDLTGKNPKIYSFYQTEAQATLAFKMGEVDEIMELSSIDELQDWKNTDIKETVKYNRIVTLFFNVKDPLLADKDIRQGLAYAIPDIPYERAYSPISKTSWAYSDTIEKYLYEPELSKKLIGNINEASTSGRLTLSTFSQYLDVAQLIARSWTQLGLQTDIRVEKTVPADFQVLLSALDVPPDPDQYLFWHSTQERTNVSRYVNVKIDKLLEDGRQELDMEKRKEIYEDFQRYLIDDAPAIFLYYPTLYTVRRK